MSRDFYAIMHPSVEKIWREAAARDLWRHAWRGYRLALRELVSGYLQPRTVLERFGTPTLLPGEIGGFEGIRFIDTGFRFIPHKGEVDMSEHGHAASIESSAQRATINTNDAKQRRRFHHDLKIWPEPFGAVLDGTMRHQVRRSDRDFGFGDTVTLKEFIPEGTPASIGGSVPGRYTGREWHGTIGFISIPGAHGLPLSLCVFTISERFA